MALIRTTHNSSLSLKLDKSKENQRLMRLYIAKMSFKECDDNTILFDIIELLQFLIPPTGKAIVFWSAKPVHI